MAGTVKPTDPSHFICVSCGRTYNYSLREITEKGNQCVNCVSEQGGILSENDEERILIWKRGMLLDAARDYYNAALSFAAKTELPDISKVTISGPWLPTIIVSDSIIEKYNKDTSLADA